MSGDERPAQGPESASRELRQLREELAAVCRRERDLQETRRAVLNLLEDLDDDRKHLAQAEQEWRAAFDGIRDAMFMHDAQDRIMRANRAYLSLARRSAAEIVGRPYWEVFPLFPLPLADASPEETVEEREIAIDERVFRSRSFLVRDEQRAFLFALRILENVTERRRADEEIQHRSEALLAANQALEKSLADLKTAEEAMRRAERLAVIGTLAAGIAHELNNPLMGVLNYVEYAEGKMSDPKGRESLAKAERELVRMEKFISDLLRLGRPSEEKLEPTGVEVAVERAIDLLGTDLGKSAIQVVRELPEDLPLVWGSPPTLQQVFLNLLLNAIDAMAQAERKVLCIKAWTQEHLVHVVVSDTGIGIPKEHERRLFEPFFTTKPEGQGTGLGLSMSQKIISGFGGTLEYLPQSGPGASFALTLRVAEE